MTSPFIGQPGEAMPRPATAVTSGGGAPGVAVVVIDSDQTTRSKLAMQLGQGATPFPSLNDLASRLTGQPVVMVLGPSFEADGELEPAEQLMSARREVGAIMVTHELTTSLLQRGLRAGVKDVLELPADPEQLVDAVRRTAATLQVTAPTVPTGPTLDDGDGQTGGVITVFSTKGGSGKSVVATNLGVILAERAAERGDKPVVLLDADLQFGDVAVMLKLSPAHTIVQAVSALDRLDAPLLANLLTEHPSGLLVLSAPLEPAFADQIGAEDVVRIVEVLRSIASHVIVDTPAYFNEVVLALLEASDDVLLVAGLDIPNIKNVKIGLQTLKLLGTPPEKLRLVLNRSDTKVRLDIAEVERTLGMETQTKIPSDVVVPQSVNRGTVVVTESPKSGVARSLEELADEFAPRAASRKKR